MDLFKNALQDKLTFQCHNWADQLWKVEPLNRINLFAEKAAHTGTLYQFKKR